MTTRKWMAVVGKAALALWLSIAMLRAVSIRAGHFRPNPSMPGVFAYDTSYCDRRPIWPKFWRTLLGLAWPGSFVCPDHPSDEYVEYVEHPAFWPGQVRRSQAPRLFYKRGSPCPMVR